MIIFPKGIRYNYPKVTEAKKALKLIEKSVRLLGNFDKKEPIIIENYNFGDNCNEKIFYLKDLDNTIFEFYNYRVDYNPNSDLDRYRKNYYIKMKKIDSIFTYKYSYEEYKSEYSDFTEKLRMIEVSVPLSDDRIIRLGTPTPMFSKIEVEEKGKIYLFGYGYGEYYNGNREDSDSILSLESFDKVAEQVKELKTLNLEKLLSILPYQRKIIYISIDSCTDNLARIKFDKGIITEYEITDNNEKITVDLAKKMTRNTEMKTDDIELASTVKIGNENYEILKSDYKRLFKQL